MPFPLSEKCWNVQIDGELTFFGVLDKYYDLIGDKKPHTQNTLVTHTVSSQHCQRHPAFCPTADCCCNCFLSFY